MCHSKSEAPSRNHAYISGFTPVLDCPFFASNLPAYQALQLKFYEPATSKFELETQHLNALS